MTDVYSVNYQQYDALWYLNILFYMKLILGMFQMLQCVEQDCREQSKEINCKYLYRYWFYFAISMFT